MTNAELIKQLRGCKDIEFCSDCPRMPNGIIEPCGIKDDAAAALEAADRLLDQNTKRCEGLRQQLREAHESYEKHINELEAQLPKEGEWIPNSPFTGNCSECGGAGNLKDKYCASCGARMRGENDAVD